MTSSTKACGTGANQTGIGTNAWVNPTSIYTSNDARASGQCPTNYLKATNFGFSLPSDAIVEGIVVNVERLCFNANVVTDNVVKLLKAGTIVGDNKALASYWPTSDTTASYGASNDLWGETWTYSDINSSTFGVVTSATAGLAYTAYVDYIAITVYYSVLVQMQSAITQTATVASELTRELRFATSIVQTPSVAVNLTAYANFKAAISQVASVVPNLKVTQNFKAALSQIATVAAELKPRIRIAAVIANPAIVEPTLKVGIRVKSAVSQVAAITARLLISWSQKQPHSGSWTNKTPSSQPWTNK
jgi:hypothetical protein